LCKWICGINNFKYYIYLHFHIFFNLILKEAFVNAAQLNDEVKWTEFDVAFCKNLNLYSKAFLHFSAKCRKSVKTMTHWKKNRGHQTSKIVNTQSSVSYSNGHLPYDSSLYYLACALNAWRGVWILCTVRMHRNN